MKKSKMDILLIFYTLILIFFHYVECNEETVNTCVAHSLPSEVLGMLMQSSAKILNINTNEFISNLQKIQENIDQMKETFASLSKSSENEFTNKSLNDILLYQKSFSEMLNSVFNTVLNNNNVVEDMKVAYSQNFLKLGEKIADLVNKEEITKEESPRVESIIPEVLNITTNDSELIINDEQINCRPTEYDNSELLRNQNETNELLNTLLVETRELKALQKEIENLSNENHILKKKLNKYQVRSRPSDCSEILTSGFTASGIYEIYPSRCECGPSIRVWCDMEAEGGGWTVILPRAHNKKLENFTRSWSDYENGFGHPESEYWIGLRTLHQLTANRRFALRLDVTSRSNRLKWAQWKKFEVASAEEKYKLTIGEFEMSSTLGDVFRKHDNQHFSTFDSDNDSSYDKNCASLLLGGWWYGKCYDIHPTGSFEASDIKIGVSTSLFGHSDKALVSLKKVIMKIKPLECVLQNSLLFSTKSCNND